MIESDGPLVPGVRELEHTADVGLEVTAPTLPEMFRRAALGAMWLVLGREAERPGGVAPNPHRDVPGGFRAPAEGTESREHTRPVELVESDLPALLRSWLRALLFWEETDGFVVVDSVVALAPAPLCSSPTGQAFGLRAQVLGRYDHGSRLREIKGVTLHGLEVEREGDVWREG